MSSTNVTPLLIDAAVTGAGPSSVYATNGTVGDVITGKPYHFIRANVTAVAVTTPTVKC